MPRSAAREDHRTGGDAEARGDRAPEGPRGTERRQERERNGERAESTAERVGGMEPACLGAEMGAPERRSARQHGEAPAHQEGRWHDREGGTEHLRREHGRWRQVERCRDPRSERVDTLEQRLDEECRSADPDLEQGEGKERPPPARGSRPDERAPQAEPGKEGREHRRGRGCGRADRKRDPAHPETS